MWRLLLLCIMALPLMAQTPPPEPQPVTQDEINAVAEQLYCPVCEMEPLDTCMAPSCVEWRGEIRTQLESGRNDAQIVDYFIDTYGNQVVGIPDDSGLQLMSFAIPILGLLAAVAAGFYLFRNRADAPAQTQTYPVSDANEEDDDYRSRLETDLNR